MVNACCVINCYTRSHDRHGKRLLHGVRFFSFPGWKQHLGQHISQLTKRRRMAWLVAVGRKDLSFDNISRHMFVCSRHFLTGKPAYEMMECHPDWVPSLHLGHTELEAIERLNRRPKRGRGLKACNGARLPVLKSEIEAEPLDESILTVQIDEVEPLNESSLTVQINKTEPLDESTMTVQFDEAEPLDGSSLTVQINKTEPLDESSLTVQIDKTEPLDESTMTVQFDEDAPLDESSLTVQINKTEPLDDSSLTVEFDEAEPMDGSSLTVQIDKDAPSDESSQGLQMDDESALQDHTEEHKECSLCRCRRDQIKRLLKENRLLKEQLSKRRIGEDFLKDDDEKVTYYTGLPCFAVLMGLLQQLLPCLPKTGQKLSPFQMFLMTLMRLRLNLPVQHIAHLFCIGKGTVYNTFRDTISAMFTHLSPLVHWPKRQCLQGSMSGQFVEAFGNRVAIIVDCFDITAQRASTVHTLKYLIGITPRGAIAFSSKGWGGGVSDKDVIESSGLLNKLMPGDLVLAEQGHSNGDDIGLVCAEVKMRKLVLKNMEETRKIAHLRVHLKRVIGCVRTKYPMLSETLPVSMVVPCEGEDMIFLDKIVTVCCALTNMCPSVMKL